MSENKSTMNMRQRMLVILADILMLAEVCIGMYHASMYPDELTPVFMKTFLPMLIPTIALTLVGLRLLREKQEVQASS